MTTILLVDDDELFRALVRAVLSRSPDPAFRAAGLIEAADLAHARLVLDDRPVDIVLLDIHLPDGDSLDLARELVGGGAPRPAVIAITGDERGEQRRAALGAGCDAYIEKSSMVGALTETLSAHLPPA